MSMWLDVLNSVSAGAVVAALNSLWPSVAVATAVWAVLKFTPRINAATRYVVWWALLGVALLLPVAAWVAARPAAVQPPSQETSAQAEAIAPLAVAEPVASENGENRAASAPQRAAEPVRLPALPIEMRASSWPLWVFAAWACVFLFHLGRIAWSYRYLRDVKRRAHPAPREHKENFDEWVLTCRVRRDVRLLVSGEIASPIAVGFRQPAVILPESLLSEFPAADLDHVLLHELAHIARRDDWMNLAAHFAAALLTLDPVAAWILQRIRREREIACDDWVVAMTGAAKPYATILARLSVLCRARRHALAAGIADHASQLAERIELLLRRGREFAPGASPARVAVSAAALAVFVIAGAHSPRWIALAQEPPPAPPDAPAIAAAPPAPAQAPVEVLTPAAPVEPAPAPMAVLARPAARHTPRAMALPPAQPSAPEQPVLATPAALAPDPPSAAPMLAASQTPTPGPPPPAPPAPQETRSRSFLAALVAAGYGDLPVDEIIELHNNGVDAAFIAGISRSGWGKLATKQLIELRIQGVSPEFVRRVNDAGLKSYSLADVVQLHQYGVRPEYLAEIHSLGFGPYSAKQGIELAMNGVKPELFRALKDAGFTQLEVREAIDAQTNGLGARSLREAQTYGSKLTLKQIIRLKQAGVI